VLRARRIIFSNWIKELEKRPLRILDVGGRYHPYRPLLAGRIGRYVAVDVEKTALVTVVADGQALPFAPESFDLAMATQVFEYFPDPHLAARQIHSALRPNGVLFASLVSFAPRFVEPERWRFTREGIRSVFAPFAQVEVVPEIGSIGGIFRAANLAGNFLVRYNSARVVYNFTICPMLNLLGRGLEQLNLTSDDRFTSNYSVRAIK
jgi:SAM-dependent methyltransferase